MRADITLSRSVGLWARMAAAARAAATAWTRRKLVCELASLDDYLLRDMGITRQDITSVLADPGPDDPTLRLAARAREARWGRRATALEERRWAAMLSRVGHAPGGTECTPGRTEHPAPSEPEDRAA